MPTDHFLHRTRIWFDELDALGVLHHSRFAYHLERAAKAMFGAVMGSNTLDPRVAPDILTLVRDLDMRFVAPVVGECEIVIALRIERVRAAGLTVAFEFRSADETVTHCRGSRTVCRVSPDLKTPVEWTENFRERYGSLAKKV